MLVLMNPYAAGGTAGKKWELVINEISTRLHGWSMYTLNGHSATAETIARALSIGETKFVAAGGDGTVNSVLNHLVRFATKSQMRHIRLGAIGLGSSNDFHKPFSSQTVNNIPYKLDFPHARARDIGCVTFLDEGIWKSRHFLVNASCGLTAEANRFFNGTDTILGIMKRFHTPTAILYAALRTILQFRNFKATIASREGLDWRGNLTNLGVLKNPHFSGDLRYDIPVEIDNGQLAVALCENMGRIDLVRLLHSLSQGKFTGLPRTKSFFARSLSVEADGTFSVEADGETIQTTSARFTILPCRIKVCP